MIAGYPEVATIFFERILPAATVVSRRFLRKVFRVDEHVNRYAMKTGCARATMSALLLTEFLRDKQATKFEAADPSNTSKAKAKENTRRIAGRRSMALKYRIFQRKCCQ